MPTIEINNANLKPMKCCGGVLRHSDDCRRTKEQIYDDEISPLMARIIEICKSNKIAMVMSFYLPDEEQDTLHCTTGFVADEYEPSDSLIKAWEILRPKEKPILSVTVEHANGEKTVTAIME